MIFRFFLSIERQFTLSLAFIGGAGHRRVAPGMRYCALGAVTRVATATGPLVLARPTVTTTCRMISSFQESRTNPVYLFGADVT